MKPENTLPRKNIKVCMLTSYFPPYLAGAELYVYEVSKYLVKQGHEVHIVTKHFGNLKPFEIMEGINVHRVRALNLPKCRSLTAFPGAFLNALKIARNCDLIHAHITYPNGIIASIIKKLTKKPYLLTLQGDELMDYPEAKELRILKPLLKFALQNADYIHCISRALSTSIQQFFSVNSKKIKIIPNGVDLTTFNPKRAIDLKKKFRCSKVIVNVSRLTPKNGVEYVIKAMPEVLKSIDAKLILIGEGPSSVQLMKLVRKLKLENDVIFLGRIDHNEVPKFIAGADVFIRTSITEGLGIVFLEAMACGTPVIASNVQGILDIVHHEENGLLVNPTDVKTISKTIIKVLNDVNLQEKLSKKALEFVKNYSWENVSKQTFELYQQIVKASSK